MNWRVLLATSLCVGGLSSCVEPRPYESQTSIRFAFPTLAIDGAYASRLTLAEIRQIRELVRNRADLKKPVDHITIDRPDEAHVTSGAARENGELSSSFDIRKKNGRWFIVEKSIQTSPSIFTS
jgi:hypothetical protein